MKNSLNKSQVERFSRQLILKNIGAKGQKKIMSSKVLIVGLGGLGCPAAENLARAGIGTIGLIDNDIVSLSNIHRQSLFNSKDIKKTKVSVAASKLKQINPSTKINFELSGYHDNVTFTVFNVTGQIVNQISFSNTLPGMQVISWNGINSNGASVPSGIYFYQVQAGDLSAMGKMTLVK